MNPIVLTGVVLITLALVVYTVAVILEQRSRRISAVTVALFAVGVVADLVATGCMAAVATRGLVNLHGLLGVSALLAMALAAVFAWRHRARSGDEAVPRWLHLYLRFVYLAWVAAYFVGASMKMGGRG